MSHAYRPLAPRRRLVLEHVAVALVVVAALAALGVLAGLVWHLVAPRTLVVFRDHTRYFVGPVPGAPVAADGWFAMIGLVAGIACGSVAQGVFHRRLVGAAVGLAVGGLLASLIAWRLGHWFGADAYEQATHTVREGGRLYAPLDVRAKGVLTLWPLAATLTVFLGAAAEEAQALLARRRARQQELAASGSAEVGSAEVGSAEVGSGNGHDPQAPYA